MNGKSDASTTTDDIKPPPLCLFYFSHPFGILSPDPPTITPAVSFATHQIPREHRRFDEDPRDEYHRQHIFNHMKTKRDRPLYELGHFGLSTKNCFDPQRVEETFTRINLEDRSDIPRHMSDHSGCFSGHCNFTVSSSTSEAFTPFLSSSVSSKHFDHDCHVHDRVRETYFNQEYHDKPQYLPRNNVLPPLERTAAKGRQRTLEVNTRAWQTPELNKRKSTLPPIERKCKNKQKSTAIMRDLHYSPVKQFTGSATGQETRKYETRKHKRPISRHMSGLRSRKSSRGIRKGRRHPNKSGVRKLIVFLLQHACQGRSADFGPSPGFSEVLKTLREAWAEPKLLRERSRNRRFWKQPKTRKTKKDHTNKTRKLHKMASNQQHEEDLSRQRPDVSPGMLRRRYSVPETIMRKYRLAQQRTDTEDSGTATAPSPVHRPASPASPSCSPSRASCASLPDSKPPRARCALRDREIMRRSTLLRRLWSRQGVAGPYASSGELRSAECYAQDCPGCFAIKNDMDSCKACEMNSRYESDYNFDKGSSEFGYCRRIAGNWSPAKSQNTFETRGCECCKKLLQYSSKDIRIPNGVPLHFSGPARSPKRQRLESHGNINRANEMLRTAMRNSYEKMEESHKQKEITTDSLPDTSTTLEFSNSISIPSASTTFSSSLRTSENGTVSSPVRGDRSSEISSRYSKSSSNPSRSSNENESRSKDFLVRPSTTGSNLLNESLKTPPSSNVKKRRQSVCIYMNAFESPVAEIKSGSLTDSNIPYDVTLDDNIVGDLLPDGNQNHTPSSFTISTKTLISEEQTKTSTSSKTETTNDGNGNAPSSSNSQFNDTSNSAFTNHTPTENGTESGQYTNGTDNYIHDKLLSDMNVYENNCNLKNFAHNTETLAIKSNNIENNNDKKLSIAVHPKPQPIKKTFENTNVEFLEIVVSETLNSSAFLESYKNNNISLQRELDKPKRNLVKKLCGIDVTSGKIELDEYVSFVLIESLNSMTEQLEEINASVDKDKQLNIIEKEIKVKLQGTGTSPITDIIIDKSFLDEVVKNTAVTKNTNTIIDFKLNGETLVTDAFTQEKNTKLLNARRENPDNSDKIEFKGDIVNCDSGNVKKICGEEVGNFVLKQIEQIIKKDFKSDHNLNYVTIPSSETHPSVAHFEISNVDVFIDSLRQDKEDNTLKTQTTDIVPSSHANEPLNSCSLMDVLQNSINANISNNYNDSPITKVGTATYYKTNKEPVLVPRFSAYPLSDSMEVNPSSEDDTLKESDTGSLVDSLEDPNSPRVTLNLPKKSKYDKKLVRGDIITLLPENTQKDTNHLKAFNEKSESFFIRLKDNECDCQKENIIVADHMPESLKDKLYRRQKKRELHMEHIKKKRLRHMKRELEKQKKDETIKLNQAIEQDCITIMNRLLEQVTDKLKGEERRSINKKVSKSKEYHSPIKHPKIEFSKTDKYLSKTDLKYMETFKIDKHGNTLYQQPVLQEFRHLQKRDIHNRIVAINPESNSNENNSSSSDVLLSPDLLGPKRVYQKSEFRDGNKRVEILEIIECLDSSPEFYSDDNGCATVTRWHRRSRIPIPIHERVHRSSRSKHFQKAFRNSTPTIINKPERALDKSSAKVDQLIADILIDALKDNGANESKINFVKSPKERSYKEHLNQWPTSTSPGYRRASVPLQESPLRFRPLNTPRYSQKFDIIPEEKSSISIESSVEDSNVTRRTSLPNEMRSGCTTNGTKIQCNPIENNIDSKDNLKWQQPLSPTKKSILKNPLNQITDTQYAYDVKVKAPRSPLMKTLKSACTSPIPQRVSAATSPIPQLYLDREVQQDNHTKTYGKKSLSSKGTKEGWIGFCRPNSRTPEEEGSSKTNHKTHSRSYEDLVGKNEKHNGHRSNNSSSTSNSHHMVKTVDSGSLKQVTIAQGKSELNDCMENFEVNLKRSKDIKRADDTKGRNKSKEANKDTKRKKRASEQIHNIINSTINRNKSSNRENTRSPDISDEKSVTDYVYKQTDTKRIQMYSIQKSESLDSFNEKSLKLPSPFKDQSFSRSSCTYSSSSDSDSNTSDKGLLCPIGPKWLSKNTGTRQKRNNRKKTQYQDLMQHNQNVPSGWSVTVAGNNYTTIPSDVDVRLSFPKATAQQATSQSDSGFGDDQNSRRRAGNVQRGIKDKCCSCKRCEDCDCIKVTKNQNNRDGENVLLLPPAQRNRKLTLTLQKEGRAQKNRASKTRYEMLPILENGQNGRKKSTSSVKMAQQFSLHCWLPENESTQAEAVARVEIIESNITNVIPTRRVRREPLSVMGCAIKPGAKPRVPTMSERDLTRIHTEQFYSRR